MEFATTHLDLPVSNWVYQIIGWMAFNKGLTVKAIQDVKAALKVLDSHLLKNSYMVGNGITLADITLVCTLYLPFHLVRLAALEPCSWAPQPPNARACIRWRAALRDVRI